jgi:hypothetical protein
MRRGSQRMQISTRWVQGLYMRRGCSLGQGEPRAHEKRIIEAAAEDKVGPGPMRRGSQRMHLRTRWVQGQ